MSLRTRRSEMLGLGFAASLVCGGCLNPRVPELSPTPLALPAAAVVGCWELHAVDWSVWPLPV